MHSYVCRGKEKEKRDRGKEQLATSGNSIFTASPLCLNSRLQSGLDHFFSQRFSPTTCAPFAETEPPICTVSEFHKNYLQFDLVIKHFSAFELCFPMYISRLQCNCIRLNQYNSLLSLSKTYFFHYINNWRSTKGINPGHTVAHG